MTPTTRLSAEERRDEIVAAAMTEFAETGYAGTSTEAIARRSGVSQPYLFQLFGTKKDLFIAAVRHGFGRTRTRLRGRRPARAAPRTRRLDHVLHAMGEAYCDPAPDRELLLCQLQAYAACSDPEIRQAVGEEFTRIYRLVRDLSGASDHELEEWFAMGMLMNTAAAIGPEMAEVGLTSPSPSSGGSPLPDDAAPEPSAGSGSRPLFSPQFLVTTKSAPTHRRLPTKVRSTQMSPAGPPPGPSPSPRSPCSWSRSTTSS